nr:MAG TPA: hypothetical protein [Caudoviricetes sp.]
MSVRFRTPELVAVNFQIFNKRCSLATCNSTRSRRYFTRLPKVSPIHKRA